MQAGALERSTENFKSPVFKVFGTESGSISAPNSPPRGSTEKLVGLLANHREAIVAFDFFTVPTVTFKLLYCFFVIEHGRRKILHFNVTQHPTAEWVVQQLRETFPDAGPYRYVILDRDAKFDGDVIAFLKATGLKPKRTSVRAPWQNGIAERWVGGCRREMLDHVIPWIEEAIRQGRI